MSVSVPPIREEERAEIARHVRKLGEEAKIAIRAIRQEARQRIEVSGRGSQRRIQEATDAAVAEIDRLVKLKIEEVGLVRSAGHEAPGPGGGAGASHLYPARLPHDPLPA